MSSHDEHPGSPPAETPSGQSEDAPSPTGAGDEAPETREDTSRVRRSPSVTGLSDEMERARAVAEVLADQAARHQARRSPARRRGTTLARVVAMVILAAASVYVWAASPSWLEPAPLPEMTVEREDAGLRLAMYIQAQRIEAFRDERGRLPDQLRETGEPLPGMVYERVDARTYRLRGGGDHVTLTYVSDDSLRAFAGNPEEILGVEL